MAHLRVLVAVQDCKSVFLRSKLVCFLVVWEVHLLCLCLYHNSGLGMPAWFILY